MSADSVLLRLKQVCKQYVTCASSLPVLNKVDLEVQQGESLAIVGPSGSGKSTLLNIIGTLDRPDSGEVLLEGENLAALNEERIARIRNQRIGFVFQLHHLLPQCSALENVLVPTLAGGTDRRDELLKRAQSLLARVGLEGRMQHRPGELSGGERQRVALVRALINQPPLLLADEPTGALDRASAEGLADLLVELNQEERVTLILVTHAPDLARRMGRRVELRDGRLIHLR